MNAHITAQEWFALGERVPFDLGSKRILRPGEPADSPDVVHVFRRVQGDGEPSEGTNWATFLPGFPDGSFGWARPTSVGYNVDIPELHKSFSEVNWQSYSQWVESQDWQFLEQKR